MKSFFLTVLAVFFAVFVTAQPNKKWVQHIEDKFQAEFIEEIQIPWNDQSVSTYEIFMVATPLHMHGTEMLVPNGANDVVFKDCMASSVFSAGFIEGLMEKLQQKTLQENPHI